MIFSNMLCIFACFHQILLLARILRCAYAEPHQVVGGAAARAHANTTILDYVKMLPEKMHQSLDFEPFSAYGSIHAVFRAFLHSEGVDSRIGSNFLHNITYFREFYIFCREIVTISRIGTVWIREFMTTSCESSRTSACVNQIVLIAC